MWTDNLLVNKIHSSDYRNGDLKAETESEIVAAQDQKLHTKYYGKKY